MKRWAMKTAGDDRILWVLGANVGVAERRATKMMSGSFNVPYERVLGDDDKPLSVESTEMEGN